MPEGSISVLQHYYAGDLAGAAIASANLQHQEANFISDLHRFEQLILIVGPLIFWLNTVNTVRRYHDRNKSGYWVLTTAIPLFGEIWQLVELGFLPGTKGSNDFGPPPNAARKAATFEDEANELREDTNFGTKLDDKYFEEYATRYRAEQEAKILQASNTIRKNSFGAHPASSSFGKRLS